MKRWIIGLVAVCVLVLALLEVVASTDARREEAGPYEQDPPAERFVGPTSIPVMTR